MYTALEQRIIAKASELFLLHGIKAVTMDFLATEMGISKRTLYERFKDKETLLRKTWSIRMKRVGKNVKS